MDKKEYKKFVKKIRRFAKGKGKMPSFIIEHSPGDFTFITHEDNIKKTPFPELTEEQKQKIDTFIEKIQKEDKTKLDKGRE